MALTFRTGSGGKGSALTIDELDNNFRHFTGSHTVSGSVTVSGSINISGSIIPTEETATLGTLDNPWKSVISTEDSFILVSGSDLAHVQATASIKLNDGKVTFDSNNGVVMTGSFTGSHTGSGTGTWDRDMSGSFTGSYTGSGTGSWDGDMSGSFSGSFTGSGLVTDITASRNISSSANVAGLSGSFTALILTAPNGNQFKFTTDNSGILSITGSAV